MRNFAHNLDNAINSEHLIQTSFINDEEIIPIVYGTAVVTGKIIWLDNLPPKYAAISICQGPIDNINYIIINNYIIPLWVMFKLRQNSKSYEEKIGVNNTPSTIINNIKKDTQGCYKDLAYIVIEIETFKQLIKEESKSNASLSEIERVDSSNIERDSDSEKEKTLFDNSVLNWEFEFNVTRNLDSYKINDKPLFTKTKDLISCISIIPGSGEFVYDTIEQISNKRPVNKSAQLEGTNSIINLKYLKELKNLKWVSIIVSWYASSTDIQNCIIYPAVEVKKSEGNEWKVSNFTSNNAKEIGKDDSGSPRYGGTPDDESLKRYIRALKDAGYKIMLYPFIQVDNQSKSWRGEITGNSEYIQSFFERQFNPFIMHYANIAKEEKVDAFVIGSEMKGLTRIYSGPSNNRQYIAVEELCKLTERLKQRFLHSNSIQIIYAADWSEYQRHEGWYNMDPLFMLLDVIGLDIYFPLTYTAKSLIRYQEIKKGITSGLDYDYYLDGEEIKYCNPEYACKRIKEWWENSHINPNGQKSNWNPKAKKIWFTEFGFASVDKSTNQPNIFYVSTSKNAPRFSHLEVDFALQEQAIHAMIEEFKSADFLSEDEGSKLMFVWCWDARYPFWPENKEYWKDAPDYIKGHWICGKLNAAPIVDIISHLCCQAGFEQTQILPPINIKDLLQGIVINSHTSILSVMQLLQKLFCIDLYTKENYLLSYRFQNEKHQLSYQEQTGSGEQNNSKSKEEFDSELKIHFNEILLKTNLVNNYCVTSYQESETSTIFHMTQENYDVDVEEPYIGYSFSTASKLDIKKIYLANIGKLLVIPTSTAQDLANHLLFNYLKGAHYIVFCIPYVIDIFPSYLIKLYDEKITVNIEVTSVYVKEDVATIKGLVLNYIS